MKIHELIENEQLDELNLAGIGSAVGKGLNAAGKAVGGAVGSVVGGAQQFGRGVKAGYLGSKNTVGGEQQPATAPAGNQPAQAGAAAAGGAPADQQAQAGAAPAAGGTPAAQGGTAPADQQAQGGAAPVANAAPAAQPGVGGSNAPASGSTAEPAQDQAGGAPEMKAAEIVQSLDGVWSKATANQGSQTSAPAVQNQIRAMAKQAGLAGQTIKENKKKITVNYHSKFLNQII